MKYVLILIALVLFFAIYVRVAPTDTAKWHTDPSDAPTGNPGGFALRPGGDESGPVFATDAAALLTELDRIAMATPRTTRLAGSVAEGQITYVTRSNLWGFPDYTTISVADVPGGVTPLIYARLRFGHSDMGVNRARIKNWLTQLDFSQGG